MSLRQLYQEMIIDHGKNPRNFGLLTSQNHEKKGHNPLCGDELTLQLLKENNVVREVKFTGKGCAICMASASLMTETIKNQSITDILELFHHFHALVTEGQCEKDLGKLAIFSGVAEFPVRVKCATLPWHVLKAVIDDNDAPISTER